MSNQSVEQYLDKRPIDFRLYYGSLDAICIDYGGGKTPWRLGILNQSDKQISLAQPDNGAVSSTNYHFKLELYTNVIEGFRDLPDGAVPNDKLDSIDGWGMLGEKKGRFATFYFLKTAALPLEPAGNNGNRVVLPLNKLTADPRHGSGTTRVKLTYGQWIHRVHNNVDPSVGSQSINHTIHVLSHRGKKHIPLHVGFVGSNRVLNDGSSNRLRLRITNASKPAVNDLLSDLAFNHDSKFIIGFDAGPTSEEWALGTENQIDNIDASLTANPNKNWAISDKWTIHPHQNGVVLAADEEIEIQLDNILTRHPSGHAKLYLHYENIPGYWDGKFVCTIEKSPLLYRGQNVGIGTAAPEAQLHIGGNGLGATDHAFRMGGRGQFVIDAPGVIGGRLAVAQDGNVGIGTANPGRLLHIQSDSQSDLALLCNRKGGKDNTVNLDFQTCSDSQPNPNARISVKDAGKFSADIAFQTKEKSPSKEEARNAEWNESLRITSGGLEVKGNIKISEGNSLKTKDKTNCGITSGDGKAWIYPYDQNGNMWLRTRAEDSGGFYVDANSFHFRKEYGEDWLNIDNNGNVGIGATLEVNGDIKISEGDIKISDGNSLIATNGNSRIYPSNKYGDMYLKTNEDGTRGGFFVDANSFHFRKNKEEEWLSIDNNGNVGIGTTSPDERLEVAGNIVARNIAAKNINFNNIIQTPGRMHVYSKEHLYLLGKKDVRVTKDWGCSGNLRIYGELHEASDRRAKNIIGKSDNGQDLETLTQLQITDFTIIDEVDNERRPRKMLIAQQVKEVYPLAVRATTEFIPNVYDMSVTVHYDASCRQLIIKTAKAHGFAVGDTVRLRDGAGHRDVEALDVTDAHSFTVHSDTAQESVFVYGKRVDDFLMLNYDAIAMLNVSATQELTRRVEAQAARIERLETENAEMKAANAEIRT